MSVRGFLGRLAGALRGPRAEDDLKAEMQAHLEMETAENIRRGMDPPTARRQALLATGGLTQATESVRDQRGLPWLESAAADLRYALRALRHSPGFTAIVVVTLALGIGANTAIFSVVRGVLLRPLPHRDGDRLVYLRQSADGPGRENLSFSVPEVRDFRTGAPSLGGGIAEYSGWSGVLQGDEDAARISLGLVTGNYFEVMGLSPVLGRLTGPADDGPAAAPVMVLTHQFWIRRFGGDSNVVGKEVRLDGKSVSVIGVLQPAPNFPYRADAIVNMVNSAHHLSASMVEGRTHRMTEMVARLAPGASLSQARAEVDAVTARIHQDYPGAYDTAAHYRVTMLPLREALGERAQLTLWLLMAAAAFVLVISAANVANLTLMRGVRREHELVVRAALGAGAGRLRRLLLAENLVLAFTGGALGIALTVGALEVLVAFAARFSPRAAEIRLDLLVLGFALGISLMVALLLSYAASLPREGMFASWISAEGRRTTGTRGRRRLQHVLVIAQVAVSVVLLAGAGLLTRTLIQLSNVETGLATEEVLTMQVALLTPGSALRDPNADVAAKARYEQMRAEVAALPGVALVGLGSPMPLRSSEVFIPIKVEGQEPAPGEAVPSAELRTADPGFFRAAGVRLLAGREFASTDQADAPRVVIVNQALVDRLFPDEDPVGKRIAWTGEILRFTPLSPEWRTVVGVVVNTRDGGQDAVTRPAVFQPFTQFPAIGTGLVIRTDSNAAGLIGPATRIVRRLAPASPIENVLTITQIKDQSVAPRRLNAILLSSFGVLALTIAAVGIAGVLAFSVSARTNEIGIRMSLGADGWRVQRMILREGGSLVALGMVLGLAGAFFATRAVQGLLFGVEPRDPATFIGVSATMAAIGLLACWIPALRAARIDPAITMRAS